MPLRLSSTRRKMLAVLGIAGLSGCSATKQFTDASTVTSRTTETTSTTTRALLCNPPSTDVDTEWYVTGEWHTITFGTKRNWRLTVSDVELTRTFHHEGTREAYEMSDGEQLAVVTSKVDNPTSEIDTWEHGEELVVIMPNGTIRRPISSLEHPAGPFRVANFRSVEHSGQYTPEGYVIEPGRTKRVWWVMVVPQDLTRSSLQIGFDSPGGPEAYDVRWLLPAYCK